MIYFTTTCTLATQTSCSISTCDVGIQCDIWKQAKDMDIYPEPAVDMEVDCDGANNDTCTTDDESIHSCMFSTDPSDS